MATYGNMVITQAGQTLYGKVQTGTALEFTRFQIGSGQLASSGQLSAALVSGTAYTSLSVNALSGAIASGSTIVIGTGSTTQTVTTSAYAAPGDTTISVNSFAANAAYAVGTSLAITQNQASLTTIITPIDYITINSISTSGSTANVLGIYQNTNLSASTYTCEIGLYAQDPTAGEILYAYSNAGSQGDTIPPYADGPYSRQFQINTAVGNATSVTATIPADTYVPVSDKGAANGVATLDGASNVVQNVTSAQNLTKLSTTHGTPADFYGATTIHGGVGLTVNALTVPGGLTVTNATSGAVGANIAANTTYSYELTAVSYSGTETNASASVTVTTGATAYPINLSWTTPSADTQYINIYKGGNFLAQVAGSAISYTDSGNTATTSQVPPTTNKTGLITFSNGVGLIADGGGKFTTGAAGGTWQTTAGAGSNSFQANDENGRSIFSIGNAANPTVASLNNTLDDGSGDMIVNGSISLPNNIALWGKDTGGTYRTIGYIDSSDALRIGDNANIRTTYLQGNGVWAESTLTLNVGVGTNGGDGTSAIGIVLSGNMNGATSVSPNQTYAARNATTGHDDWGVVASAFENASGTSVNNAFSVYALSGAVAPYTISPTLFAVNRQGAVTTVGKQASSGSLGVATVVAQAQGVHVTATTQQTILSFTPSVTGIYEIEGSVSIGNSTSGQYIRVNPAWTDAATSTSVGNYATLQNSNYSGLWANGGTSIPSQIFSLTKTTMYAKAGTTISLLYTDPSGTPNDYVSAVITRLA